MSAGERGAPLKDKTYAQGAAYLLSSMGCLTVLRPAMAAPPLRELETLLVSLLRRDAWGAAYAYHACHSALLAGGYRRVSGDLFRDFLYDLLLERKNAFSRGAAAGKWDEPLAAAMRADLTQLSPFFSLGSMTLKRWIGECKKEHRIRPRQQQDNISVLSNAVWGGQSRPPLQQEPREEVLLPEFPMDESSLPSWRYQNEPPEEEGAIFAAESALEELYHRLDIAEDRGVLLDDIWTFHSTYGTGMFVRQHVFTLLPEGTLRPVAQVLLPREDSYTFYRQQREQCVRNAIRFMRGEACDNMLLLGGPGTGKSAQVYSLCRELPELRLIACPPGTCGALIKLLPELMEQPLRFAIFLDDFDDNDPLWPQLKAAFAPAGVQPENLLLIAAAQSAASAFFPLLIRLPAPHLNEFIELVQTLLLRENMDMDFEHIRNACIDYAAATGATAGKEGEGASPLSFRSARIIAGELLASN